jgi:TRAP-type transport system periplasmic protein
VRTPDWLRKLALVAAAALLAAACTAGAGGGDKAGGGGQTVVLRLAETASNLGYAPALQYFISRVDELSGGDLRIDVVYEWGNFSADAEQQAVRDVAAGKAELTRVNTGVFDTLGVDSFRALLAPMLIDSYAMEDAVVRSDIPGQMLRGLDRIDVVGLAILATSMPKLIAVHKPLLGPEDWGGITFQAYRSDVAAEAIRALGAQPTDTLGGLPAGLESGQIQGFAKSLRTYQLNETEHLAPYVTANVNLWPGMQVLLANPGRLSRLSGEQRGWLRQAAGEAVARSASLVEHEDQIVADVCQAGARLSNASQTDLTALRQAFVPVYSSLEEDPETKSFIARIEALKESTPAGAPLAIPVGCSGPASGGPNGNEDPVAGS